MRSKCWHSSCKIRIGAAGLVVWFILALTGCASLPDYAAPTITLLEDENVDISDVIPYRALTRDDFRGIEPPAQYDERMAAVTCVYTQPIVDKQAIDVQPVNAPDGSEAYEVTYNNLKYQALMNRNCSWWNTATRGMEENYVLEHEQIHFALFEIAARKWSQGPPIKFQVRADTREAMLENLQAQFEELLQQRLRVLLQQNRKFDVETSVGRNAGKQKRWLQMVEKQLAATSGYAVALPAATIPTTRCSISPAARRSISRAKALLAQADYLPAIVRLVEEAEAAARPPECDSVRAKILADKAEQLASESGPQ